jgi:hypothetical protein
MDTDNIIYGMSAGFLMICVCLLCYSIGYDHGFKDGVVAGWECQTDMECENLERLVQE